MNTCVNCKHYLKREKEPLYIGPCIDCWDHNQYEKLITNADNIREMTDEGLADFIVSRIADKLNIDTTLSFIETREKILSWLKQEVNNE